MREASIILGIDPGYGRCGWAVLKWHGEFEFVAAGCVETSKHDPHEQRLSAIANQLREIMEKDCPTRMVIEQLLFTKNQTTGLKVAEARGVALAVAGACGVEVVEVGPQQVKQAVTGNGAADKKQVQEMVKRLLRLKTIPRPDDAADACAIAMCGAGLLA